MNYKSHYDRLIDRAKERTLIGVYTERHHIIPKCLGGGNEERNLVELTPEEHFIAHQLLVKIYPNDHRLVFALRMMTRSTENVIRNNKYFGWIKRKSSLAMSVLMKGRKKPHDFIKTEASRKAQAERMKGNSYTLGNKLSKEHKAKIIASLIGNKRTEGYKHREESKAKMSKSKLGNKNANGNTIWLGRKHSEETKVKMKESFKNRGQAWKDKISASRKDYYERLRNEKS